MSPRGRRPSAPGTPAAGAGHVAWEPGSVRTLSERIVEELREAIIRGDLLPGQALRQVDLARRLEVSFAPLREALRQLEAEGFVRFTAFQGAIVAPLEVGELRDFLDLLAVIEDLAVRSAVPRITPAALAEAERLHEQLTREADPARAAKLVTSVRLTLYAVSGRTRLIQMVRMVRMNSSRWGREAYRVPEGRRLAEQISRGLIDRFRAGDTEGAARWVVDTYHEALRLLEQRATEMATELNRPHAEADAPPALVSMAPRRRPLKRRGVAVARPAPRRRRD